MKDIGSHDYVEVNGLRTHFMSAGSAGPTVLLLHGGGADCADLSWGRFLPELAETCRVISLDWPGYGESAKPKIAYSLPFYINFLEAFLDQLHIEKARLCGLSLGGGVALGFTLRNPQRVEKLALIDSYGLQRTAPFHKLSYLFLKAPWLNAWIWSMIRSRRMVRASLGALLQRPGALTDELVERATRELDVPNPGFAWRSFQANEITWAGTRTCFIDRLGEIDVPTLIVHGTKDTVVPAACAREAHERIRSAQLHWMEGSGHWPQRDDPEGFRDVVKPFLEG